MNVKQPVTALRSPGFFPGGTRLMTASLVCLLALLVLTFSGCCSVRTTEQPPTLVDAATILALGADDQNVRARAAADLTSLGAGGLPLLRIGLAHESPRVRRATWRVVATIAPDIAPTVPQLFHDYADVETFNTAWPILLNSGGTEDMATTIDLFHEKVLLLEKEIEAERSPEPRSYFRWVFEPLVDLGPSALAALAGVVRDGNLPSESRKQAANFLVLLGPDALPYLREILTDGPRDAKSLAVHGLQHLARFRHCSAALATLVSESTSAENDLRKEIVLAIERYSELSSAAVPLLHALVVADGDLAQRWRAWATLHVLDPDRAESLRHVIEGAGPAPDDVREDTGKPR